MTAGQRIAVVTLDTLAARMAGPGLRALRMAQALAEEHEVRLVTLGDCSLSDEAVTVEQVDVAGLMAIAEWASVLVVQGYLFAGAPWLAEVDTVLVVDLYDPLHLETLEVTRHRPEQERWGAAQFAVGELNAQVARGDFFLCASEKQRDLWLGFLSAQGRVNPATYAEDASLRRLIDVVPFGVDQAPPRRQSPAIRGVVKGIDEDDLVVLWGGGVYDWFDPLTLVRAVDRARHQLPRLRLFFLGMTHPNPDVSPMQVAAQLRRLSDELGLTGRHVFFNEGWVPLKQRSDYLLEADLGVSCHFDHLETAFSYRTRILDYLWAGLPVVTTQGDTFAEIVERERLGRTVPVQDIDALADALVELLADATERAACTSRVAEVAARMTWPIVLEPLTEFCRSPRRAPDAAATATAAAAAARAVVGTTRTGLLRDVATTWRHLRQGGVGRVREKAEARIRRRRRLGR